MSAKIPVIIDTDPGVDDITAMKYRSGSILVSLFPVIAVFAKPSELFLLSNHSLNVLKAYQAIQLQIEKNPSDAARFVNVTSGRKPILARGSDGPLEGELHSAKYFHGRHVDNHTFLAGVLLTYMLFRDGLSNISERHPELDVSPNNGGEHPFLRFSEKSGVDVALDLIRSYPARSITYIVLGPLTNLARLVRKDGDLFREKIGRIICMGGALDVPGNTSPTAEFNFFADPFAVKELLFPANQQLGLPLERFLLVSLDITTSHGLPFDVYESKIDMSNSFGLTAGPSKAADKSPLTHFTSSFLERTRTIMRQFGGDRMELHDIVAVWCAAENPPDAAGLSLGWKSRKRVFEIERTGELTRGMLVVDRRIDISAYAPGANRAKVQAELEKSGMSHGPWESTAVPAQVEIEEEVPASDVAFPGIHCITDTPGPDVLLKKLLERVWGYQENVIG